MRDRKLEIRNWPGPNSILKRTVWWPRGKVGTGNAVSDASYVVWESGLGASMTDSGDGHPPCSCWTTPEQGFCLGWLVPISQTDYTCAAYSSPWWWRQQGPLKRWWTSTRLQGATTQKTAIFLYNHVPKFDFIIKYAVKRSWFTSGKKLCFVARISKPNMQ
jgi:hypothetical protein